MKGSNSPDPVPAALLAKALYDNLPDCSDELAFCRGDILTILEQNVPENEGWWKCVLHGRQGLAPANRLQMLTKAPTDRPCAPLLGGLQAALASSEEAYQVPSLLGPPTPGPVYEHMKSWVEAPPPSTAQVYELLDRPPRARIVCEKTLSFQKQTLCTLPRPMHASWPAPPCQVYDVPAQNRVHSALKVHCFCEACIMWPENNSTHLLSPQDGSMVCSPRPYPPVQNVCCQLGHHARCRPLDSGHGDPVCVTAELYPECEKQQLYDIPPSPQKAGLRPPASQASGHSVPQTSPVIQREGYNSLPIPQKSEWIYDTPGAPKKASMRNSPLSSLVEERGSHPPLGLLSAFHSPSPDSRTRSLNQQVYKDVPRQKKLSLPEISVSGLPAPRGTYAWDDGVSYKVPSSFLVLRAEQQNTKPNIYDVPKAMSSIPRGVKEPAKAGGVTETSEDRSPTWLCTWAASRSPEPDSLLVSSSDSSRASVVSSCSSMSTDSSSSSSSEELAKELSVDLSVARETVTALQHKVASAVAGLMLHVSRKWRCREYLEANISAVHRAVDHTEESLREFLDFARGVQELTCNLSDSNLQARIKDQLQAIACSYQILRETKQGLDSCHWSLEVLATEQLPNGPDDLERLVMAARMVPEDVKRFASMVIANGKLLFKQNCEKGETLQLTPNAKSKLENCIQFPQRETESQQRSAPFNKQREPGHSPELVKKNRTNVCGQKLPDLEEKEKPILEQRANINKDLRTQSPSFLTPQSLSEQNPEKKIHLSEHCRLYFGALFKAISVFTSSLSNSQPPETFITQSKLTIVVGQKLVDTLCQETQERDVRNEILCHSSHLCGLLKNLALATKDAVLHYPSPTALQHLQAQAEKLEQHARQLRAALD